METISQIMGHAKIMITQVCAYLDDDKDKDKIRLDIQRFEAILAEKRMHFNDGS